MSLFLGNLSDHIQQEDLERVFRRFGRCNVRMKDGYGFVVFEVHFNAEKALRALRGKLICGEQINISWSNKQPRNFQKFTRNRFYEPYGRRNFREGELHSNSVEFDKREFVKHQSNNHRAFHITNSRNKELAHRHHIDPVGDIGHQSPEKVSAANEFNTAEDGRWGEPGSNAIVNDVLGDCTDFERYEPNQDYDSKDIDGNEMSGSFRSPSQRRSREKGGDHSDAQLKHLDNLRQQPVCYNCGLLGHIMRNCPRENSSRFDKPSRFYNKRFHDEDYGGRGEGESGRRIYQSRRESDRDALFSDQDLRVGTGFQHTTRKRMLKGRGKFTVLEENLHDKRTETDNSRKKIARFEQRSLEKRHKKRQRHHSTSLGSGSNGASILSHSVSSRSDAKNISQSSKRSVSSMPAGSPSHPSNSRSASISSYSRSRHRRLRSKSRSRSRSRSRSKSITSIPQSLSVSLGGKSVSVEENVNAYDSGSPSFSDNQKDTSLSKLHNIKDLNGPGLGNDLDAEMVYMSSGPVDATDEVPKLNAAVICETADGLHQSLGYSSSKRDNSEDATDGPEKPKMEFLGELDSKKVSTLEMFQVLKHYGLETPDGHGLTVGTFFGAARFWPWELIYYMRLRKGPISTENYVRRVQQNKEFGIVDKYIRSSSGWGEYTENDA